MICLNNIWYASHIRGKGWTTLKVIWFRIEQSDKNDLPAWPPICLEEHGGTRLHQSASGHRRVGRHGCRLHPGPGPDNQPEPSEEPRGLQESTRLNVGSVCSSLEVQPRRVRTPRSYWESSFLDGGSACSHPNVQPRDCRTPRSLQESPRCNGGSLRSGQLKDQVQRAQVQPLRPSRRGRLRGSVDLPVRRQLLQAWPPPEVHRLSQVITPEDTRRKACYLT